MREKWLYIIYECTRLLSCSCLLLLPTQLLPLHPPPLAQDVTVHSSTDMRAHGLLGQTWRESTYPNSIKHIMGAVDDYAIKSGDIFGDDFAYNSFE
jgi:hypothetical protein